MGNKTLTWMNGRELATYSEGTNNISYKYNLDGIRTSKTVNNVTTNYYLEGNKTIFEDRNGTVLYYMYDSDALIDKESILGSNLLQYCYNNLINNVDLDGNRRRFNDIL
jgi:YD repeat-containing protein